MPYVLKYSHSATGLAREGTNINDLMDAVKAGKPIRVVLDYEPDAGAFDASYVRIDGADVIAQIYCLSIASLDPPRFKFPGTYWYMVLLSSDGHSHVIRMNITGGTPLSDTVSEMSARWFAQE